MFGKYVTASQHMMYSKQLGYSILGEYTKTGPSFPMKNFSMQRGMTVSEQITGRFKTGGVSMSNKGYAKHTGTGEYVDITEGTEPVALVKPVMKSGGSIKNVDITASIKASLQKSGVYTSLKHHVSEIAHTKISTPNASQYASLIEPIPQMWKGVYDVPQSSMVFQGQTSFNPPIISFTPSSKLLSESVSRSVSMKNTRPLSMVDTSFTQISGVDTSFGVSNDMVQGSVLSQQSNSMTDTVQNVGLQVDSLQVKMRRYDQMNASLLSSSYPVFNPQVPRFMSPGGFYSPSFLKPTSSRVKRMRFKGFDFFDKGYRFRSLNVRHIEEYLPKGLM